MLRPVRAPRPNRPPDAPRRRRRLRTLLLACVFVVAPGAALAAMPSSGLEGLGKKVSDAELGEMRGKFVSANGVSYFGVELQTVWQTADQTTVAATMLVSINLAGGTPSPQILIGWSRDCTSCAASSVDIAGAGGAVTVFSVPTLNVGGLDTVQGAVQSQEIRGSDNVVQNAMSIAVLNNPTAIPTAGSGLTAVTSSSTESFSDGSAIHFIVRPNEVGVVLQGAGDSGLVRQAVNGDLNQVAQNVMLASDFNSIHNSVNITVGLDTIQLAEQISLQNAMSALKGRGF
jgi:hypothetical protein